MCASSGVERDNKVISLRKWIFERERKRLKKICMERYGSTEAEWKAFVEANKER